MKEAPPEKVKPISTESLPSDLAKKIQEYTEAVSGMKEMIYIIKHHIKNNLIEEVKKIDSLRLKVGKILNEIKALLKQTMIKEQHKKDVEKNLNNTTNALKPELQFLQLIKNTQISLIEIEKKHLSIHQKHVEIYQSLDETITKNADTILQLIQDGLTELEKLKEKLQAIKTDKTLRYLTDLLESLGAFNLSNKIDQTIILINVIIEKIKKFKNPKPIKEEIKMEKKNDIISTQSNQATNQENLSTPNTNEQETEKTKPVDLSDVLALDTIPKKNKNVTFMEPNCTIEITENEPLSQKELFVPLEKNETVNNLDTCEKIIKNQNQPIEVKETKIEVKQLEVKPPLEVKTPVSASINLQQFYAIKRAQQVSFSKTRSRV